MSLNGLGGCVCRMISESMRFILFFASILFMILSGLLLFITSENGFAYDVMDIAQWDYHFLAIKLLSIYLIVLSLFGIHGSFFRNETSINLFAFLASLNILLGFGVLSFASPRLHESTLQVSNRLEELQTNYDWFHQKNVSIIKNNATEKWDAIQLNHECCGLHSPKDWLKFKPTEYPGDYPITCCQNYDEPSQLIKDSQTTGNEAKGQKQFCSKNDEIWTDGCVDRITNLNSLIRLCVLALILMNLALSIMAGIVIIFQQKPTYESY